MLDLVVHTGNLVITVILNILLYIVSPSLLRVDREERVLEICRRGELSIYITMMGQILGIQESEVMFYRAQAPMQVGP